MKARIFTVAIAVAVTLAFAAQDAQALGKKDKGCLVGGAAGGVGGHVLGDHAVIGALAGCAVGTVVADKRDKKQQAEKKRNEQAARAERRRRHEEVVRNDQRRTY
jgi:Glycine zipper 2TM domain